MLRTIAYFKSTATDYAPVIDQCNQVLREDFGVSIRLSYLPDLLMVAKDSNDTMIGLLILHFTESTRAWEIGTVSVKQGQNRDDLLELLVNAAFDAINVLQNHGILNKVCWLVKRVKHTDSARRKFFRGLGFSHPNTWVENVLADTGYIPFDPFEVALMKKEVTSSQT
jgi:hypothetical protein